MRTIYLCGAINGCTDEQANDWRTAAKAFPFLSKSFCFLDPMRRDYRGRELEPGISDEIVDGDLQDIRDSSFILANCVRPSWGTAMEIKYAYDIGKVVVSVCPGKPSPWLIRHSTVIVETFAAAYRWLMEAANER